MKERFSWDDVILLWFFLPFIYLARTAFEKMTDVDYQGETYYTIRNLSLYECQVSN